MLRNPQADKYATNLITVVALALFSAILFFTNDDARYFLTGVGRFIRAVAIIIFSVFTAIGGKPS